AMDFDDHEPALEITGESFFSLGREGLIANSWYLTGSDDFRKKHRREPPSSRGAVGFAPNTVGVHLFMWAQGLGGESLTEFDNPEFDFPKLDVAVPAGNFLSELPFAAPDPPTENP